MSRSAAMARFTLPAMNFAGTPAGIDVRKVVDTGLLPIINTGIAHREAGIGQIGAGITRAPLDCFTQAVTALAGALPEAMTATRRKPAGGAHGSGQEAGGGRDRRQRADPRRRPSVDPGPVRSPRR